MSKQRDDGSRPPGPSFKNWAVLAIFLSFSAAALFMRDWRSMVGPLVLFGGGSIVSATEVRRKIRERRLSGESVQLQGGVEIGVDRRRIWAMGLGLLAAGPAFAWSAEGERTPEVLGASLALAGFVLLAALLFGWLPRQTLRFDPDGMLFGYRSFSVWVPWDAIGQVSVGEYASNPMVFLAVPDLTLVRVEPATASGRFEKAAARNRAWTGADLTVMPRNFGVDGAPLAAALSRYVLDPKARGELSPSPVIAEGSGARP
jgi:hypothetical protein